MRNAKEGVALAAIVAKETTEGKWSGTGGGLGFGTGGLGLFVGGMSGTKREQSQRAKEFEAPPKASFNWLYVFAPLILLLGIAAMFGFGSSFVQFMSDGQPAATGSLGRAQEGLGQMVSILGRFVPLLATSARPCGSSLGAVTAKTRKTPDSRPPKPPTASRKASTTGCVTSRPTTLCSIQKPAGKYRPNAITSFRC